MHDRKVGADQEDRQLQTINDIAEGFLCLRPADHQSAEDGGPAEMRGENFQCRGLSLREGWHALMAPEPDSAYEAWIVFEHQKERVDEALRPGEPLVEAVADP